MYEYGLQKEKDEKERLHDTIRKRSQRTRNIINSFKSEANRTGTLSHPVNDSAMAKLLRASQY